jgi:hypothetical protein
MPELTDEHLTDEERAGLEAAIAELRDWIAPGAAVQLIQQYLDCSIGRARALLQGVCTAVPSEVRSCNDDPAQRWEKTWCISKGDLADWLGRQASPKADRPITRQRSKRVAAERAIADLWSDGPPADMHNKVICGMVEDHLKTAGHAVPSNDTILRAAGRKAAKALP